MKGVTRAKVLGVTLNSKQTWSDHIANISDKASSVYGFICCNFDNCTAKIKSALYKIMCDLFWNVLVMFGPHIIIRIYNV